MVLRKLAAALLSVGVMLPGLSHALAIGELNTKSALGQPFFGEIELSELGDVGVDEIRVGLATQEDFERLGIERVYFLNELQFSVLSKAPGHAVVRVTSAKVLREPFLSFVMRVTWPGNNRLQDFTALIDLPTPGQVAAPEVVKPVVAPVVPPVAKPIVKPAEPAAEATKVKPVEEPKPEVVKPAPKAEVKPKPEPKVVKPAEAPAEEPKATPSTYRTRSSDTLWGVALKVKPSGASVQQTMIAIQRQNQDAFARENINALKSGRVLRIPTDSQIREVGAREAVANVAEQNRLWRSGVTEAPALTGPQVAATKPSAAPAAPAQAKAEVKLVAPGEKAVAGAKASVTGKPSAAEQKALAATAAKAAQAKAESEQAAARMKAAEAKLKENEAKLALQNQKAAEMQAKLQEMNAKKAAEEAAKQKAAQEAAAKKAADELAAKKAAEEAAAKAAAAKAAEAAKPVAAAKVTEAAPAVEAKPAPAPAEIKPEAVQQKAPEPAKPAVVAEAPAEDEGLPLWIKLAGALAVIGGGLGAIGFALKKKRDKAAEDAEYQRLLAEDQGVQPALNERLEGLTQEAGADDLTQFAAVAESLGGEDELSLDDLAADLGDFDAGVPAAAPVVDPAEEADGYIQYERYPQAIGFLTKAIAANPERTDLRLKLLECFVATGDVESFVAQQTEVELTGDLDAIGRADELRAQLPALAAPKDEGVIDFEHAPKAVAEESLDDLPSLDDLELDLNAAISESSANLRAVSDDALFAEAPKSAAEEEALDFDLSDLDMPAVEEPAAELEAKAEDFDFSFDLAAEEPAAAPVVTAEPEFGELGEFTFEPTKDAGAVAEAPLEEPALGDFEFDLAAEAPAVEEPVAESKVTFDLGEIELEDLGTELAAPSELAAAEESLDFSLDDLEALEAAPETLPTEAAEELVFEAPEADLADLESELMAAVEAEAEPAMAGDLNEVAAEFDLSLSEADLAAAEAELEEAMPALELAEPAAGVEEELAALEAEPVTEDLQLGDEFDFLADADENATKLDLAKAYIDMGDMDGAKDILEEVVAEGSADQQEEAKGLLAQVG